MVPTFVRTSDAPHKNSPPGNKRLRQAWIQAIGRTELPAKPHLRSEHFVHFVHFVHEPSSSDGRKRKRKRTTHSTAVGPVGHFLDH